MKWEHAHENIFLQVSCIIKVNCNEILTLVSTFLQKFNWPICILKVHVRFSQRQDEVQSMGKTAHYTNGPAIFK